MTPRFTTSPIDSRKLTMLAHTIARMHPGRREHIYGRIHSADCTCGKCTKEAA